MNKRIKNLDGLRFFAALLVLTRHFSIGLEQAGLPVFGQQAFKAGSQPAVTLFFVISGFLITHVLRSGPGIDLKKFYRNRALRIWPLYYFILFFVFFIAFNIPVLNPHFSTQPFDLNKFLGYLFFLPNTTKILYGNTHVLGMTWSLGVEEFFYLFFPLLLYAIPVRHHLKTCLLLFFAWTGFSILAARIYVPTSIPFRYELILHTYLPSYRLYAFFAGAVTCLALRHCGEPIHKLAKTRGRYLSLIPWGLSAILIATGQEFGYINEILFTILFAGGLYWVSITGATFKLLENKWVNGLGKISYGLYMYHTIMILLVLNLFGRYSNGAVVYSMFLWMISLLATILVSSLSYRFLEKPFLRIKKS